MKEAKVAWWGTNSAAQQAALGSGATRVIYTDGTYTITTLVTATKTSGTLEIIGEGTVTIDGSGAGTGSLLTIGGTVGSTASPSVAITAGATTITCALSVAAGDVIRIASDNEVWSSTNAAYLKGELAVVKSVSAGVITLESGTYDSYTGDAHTIIAKLNTPTVIMKNLKFTRSASDVTTAGNLGVRVQYTRNSVLENVRSEYSNYANIYVYQSLNTTVNQCSTVGNYIAGQGTDYGLLIDSSQIVRVNGGKYAAGRHGISHGGTWPYRDIVIDVVYTDNDPASEVQSFDMHANGQDVKIVNSTFGNGAYVGAINATIQNNIIRSKAANSATDKYVLQATVGRNSDYLHIIGNKIYQPAGKRGIYVYNTVSGTITLQSLQVENNEIFGTGTTLEGIYIGSLGTTANLLTISQADFVDNKVRVDGTDVEALLIASGTNNPLTIGVLNIKGGRYYSAAGRGINITDTTVVIGTTFIENALVTAATAAKYPLALIYGSSSGNLFLLGNTFSGGDRNYIDAYGYVAAKNNLFTGGVYSLGIATTNSNIKKLILEGNVDNSTSGIYGASSIQTVGMTQMGSDNGGRRQTAYTGTLAPARGVWKVGDKAFRMPPEAGEIISWSVTVAGGSKGATRANNTVYAKNAWVLWTTGTTIWRCTTAGTSAGSAPSIVGKVVGDTVTDGTAVWELMDLATATWISDGVRPGP